MSGFLLTGSLIFVFDAKSSPQMFSAGSEIVTRGIALSELNCGATKFTPVLYGSFHRPGLVTLSKRRSSGDRRWSLGRTLLTDFFVSIGDISPHPSLRHSSDLTQKKYLVSPLLYQSTESDQHTRCFRWRFW